MIKVLSKIAAISLVVSFSSYSVADLRYSQDDDIEISEKSSKAIEKSLNQNKKVKLYRQRSFETHELMNSRSSEQFWSTTIYPNSGNNPSPQSDNDVLIANQYYYMLAPRSSWAPSNPTTHVQTVNFEINTANAQDSSALRVEICSLDLYVQQGQWGCLRLKSESALIPAGTYNGAYNRVVNSPSGVESLLFNFDTTAFNSIHNADNGGYIFRVAHIGNAPSDTTMLRGTLLNFY